MELYPYKSALGTMEPIALIEHNVVIHYVTGEPYYRRVIWLEPLPPFQFLDIGAIGAATTSARTQAQNLENFDGEFSQIRWWPVDDAQVRVFCPQPTGKSVIRNLQIPVDKMIVNQNPDLSMTELFVWEDKVPWFEAINASDYTLAACRLRAMGFRFVTRKLNDRELQRVKQGLDACVRIPAAGTPGTVE